MTVVKNPIVYSCSGCSNLAQIAHDISSMLDSDGIAEMSCISGVIGKVKPVAELAYSGRPIIAIDGCGLGCTKACLSACDLTPEFYFDISRFGFEKRGKDENSLIENSVALENIYGELRKSGITFP
ncbi:putative zinc-binding protein [Thalassomonas actiniarum]|uniref:Zinc-binding protein n=1 Tax=Thalassomonas actiniarum TaxID=485447 RepID=A0AAE9YML1_9GAMM|nr:putative zinc-binding protein [Thalassomonas actiniarum]WDD97651.1 putative zinc-binding protein [Thalassomonas actiniarum]